MGPLLIAIIVAAWSAFGSWLYFDQPVPVSATWTGPVESVSFAPFRRGQNPMKEQFPSAQQVEDDMRSLIGLTKGLRTYSARQGMEIVPDLAEQMGFKVTYGAWLTSSLTVKGARQNDSEIDALIAGANAHPDGVSRVIVGNEVLLRNDLTPDQLIAYIRKVKAAVHQPVSYADVWVFFLQHPEVGRELDYLTIHILPFWEDEPVAIEDIDAHVARIVARMREAFPGKPILIGETGWPSLGRDRGPAFVNTVNEARYVRDMANLAAREGFDYNIVEAFDQPWKSELENTVGAAWGILDIDRKAKFPMGGPVLEVGDWPLRAGIAIGLGMIAGLFWGRRLSGFVALLTLALLTQVLAWGIVTTYFHTEAVTFRSWQYFWEPVRVGLAVLMAGAVCEAACKFLRREQKGRADRWYGDLLFTVYGVYAVVWTTLLFLDGRYRDIPEIDFLVPTMGVALLLGIRVFSAWPPAGERKVAAALALDGLFASRNAAWRNRLTRNLAYALPLAAAVALASEGWALAQGNDFRADHPGFAAQAPLILQALIRNREMVLWAIMQLVLAVPFVMNRWIRLRPVARF